MLKVRELLPLVFLCLCRLAPAQTATQPPAQLSLRQAVEIALSPHGNASVRLARESEVVTRAQGDQVRAVLLPSVSGSVREQRQLVNVAAQGIQVQLAGAPISLGADPFNTIDARVSAEQTIFNWSAVRQVQAAHAAVRSSQDELKHTQETVVSRIVNAYLSALRAQALLDAASSDVSLAEALAKVADDRVSAGKGLEIEATRARAQLAHARLRLLTVQNENSRARLQLCKDIGIPLDEGITLTGKLAANKSDERAIEDVLKGALDSRADLKAQMERTRQAQLLHSAAKAESMPSAFGYADYGPLGLTPSSAIETYTVGIGLKIPLFDGGRREARRAETNSRARQEQIKEQDLRAQVELEVRESLNSLRIAAAQVEAAEQGGKLAEEELAHAQRRYAGGLTTSLDVVEGQNRLERARDERVAAIYAYNLALVEAARASGNIMEIVR